MNDYSLAEATEICHHHWMIDSDGAARCKKCGTNGTFSTMPVLRNAEPTTKEETVNYKKGLGKEGLNRPLPTCQRCGSKNTYQSGYVPKDRPPNPYRQMYGCRDCRGKFER